jgi:SAM-dependent methyltransferase
VPPNDAATTNDTATAYQRFASVYDDFNYRNDYEMWLSILLPELEARGLRHGRVFDLGCGTGRSFPPLLERGWEVHGCDLTPAMVDDARRKFGDSVSLDVADARELPVLGEFDLIISLNDVVNYLSGDGDLARGLRGMRSNLAPGGMVLFDANTISLFENCFQVGSEGIRSRGWRWEGLSPEIFPGGTFQAELSGDGLEPHVHTQRHHPIGVVREEMLAAGIQPLAALGQREKDGRVVLSDPADEQRDMKIIHIGRAA